MSSTTAIWEEFETRLGAAARAVDAVVATLRAARIDRNGRLSRRVDALRAHEAELRTRLRGLHEAGPSDWELQGAALDRDLDRLRTGTAVVAARLDTELAADPDAFAAAVGAELAARHAQIHGLLAEAVAIETLQAGVRQAMAELDDMADEATFPRNDRRRSR